MDWDPITFRRLRPEDAALLSRVAPGVFDETVQPDHTAAFLGADTHEMVVALARDAAAGDLVVGMVSGLIHYHPDKPAQFWIIELGTSDEWLRRGIATQLVEAMLAIATLRGCETAWLVTEQDNRPARALYRRAGGREVPGLVMYDWGEEDD